MAAEPSYYEVLGINKDSSEKEISKAYRKKALQCHPDKNPDNPKAADLFHKLNKAFEVIGNPKAKAAYDTTLKAKERVRLRTQAYGSKRKKFKEDLEQREKSSQEDFIKEDVIVKNFEQEIERLREEGLKLLEREQKIVKEQIAEEKKRMTDYSTTQFMTVTPKLKIRWKSQKNDDTNGGYSWSLLNSIFQKYGEIENLLVSSKKKGSAIVEYQEFKAAEMAIENERGNPANPLKISWLQQCPTQGADNAISKDSPSTENNVSVPHIVQENLTTNRDFETLVMRKLRQAEERKRLCEQIAKEEES